MAQQPVPQLPDVLTVTVVPEDVVPVGSRAYTKCAVARALVRTLGEGCYPMITGERTLVTRPGTWAFGDYLNPEDMRRWVRLYDDEQSVPVPVTFVLYRTRG